MKKQDEKIEAVQSKYIKNINDYSEFTILLDEFVDPKSEKGYSLLDYILYGKNPYNNQKKSKEDARSQEEIDQEYFLDTSIFMNKIIRKNLILCITTASKYTSKSIEELETDSEPAISIVNKMLIEYMTFKKKSPKLNEDTELQTTDPQKKKRQIKKK